MRSASGEQVALHVSAKAVPAVVVVPTGSRHRSLLARARSVVLAVWGGIVGIAPHVLHHVGPLAGAALLAGVGGTLLFAGIALVVSIPFLLRMHRRFRTWVAPTVALAVMAATFSLSTFVIAPLVTGGESGRAPQQPPIEQPVTGQPTAPPQPAPSEHELHHMK